MSHPQRSDRDPNTLSNYYDLVTRHIAWTFEADFSRKVLKGHVVLTLEALVDNVQEVVVDSRDLTITKVSQDGAELKVNLPTMLIFYLMILQNLEYICRFRLIICQFKEGEKSEVFGTAIHAPIAPVAKGAKVHIRYDYETSPNSTAIQWLEPRYIQL